MKSSHDVHTPGISYLSTRSDSAGYIPRSPAPPGPDDILRDCTSPEDPDSKIEVDFGRAFRVPSLVPSYAVLNVLRGNKCIQTYDIFRFGCRLSHCRACSFFAGTPIPLGNDEEHGIAAVGGIRINLWELHGAGASRGADKFDGLRHRRNFGRQPGCTDFFPGDGPFRAWPRVSAPVAPQHHQCGRTR